MSELVLDLKFWGNNLGVRLPAAIAKRLDLKANQQVSLSVEGEQIVITPIKKPFLSLEERLAEYDASNMSGEVMLAEPVGAEKWE